MKLVVEASVRELADEIMRRMKDEDAADLMTNDDWIAVEEIRDALGD